jgi:hypothetical protein
MTLAKKSGLFSLLAFFLTLGIPEAAHAFQAQENSPTQAAPEQAPKTEEPQQNKPDAITEQPSVNPPSTDTPSSTPPAPLVKLPNKKTPSKTVAPKKLATKAATKKRPRRKSNNNKVVVKNGSTPDRSAQISTSDTDQHASQKLKDTNSLLGETTGNLQKISGKQLNPTQQDMVKQIKSYMQQSKDAVTAGDVQGANNLAVKAHLLSQELIKP